MTATSGRTKSRNATDAYLSEGIYSRSTMAVLRDACQFDSKVAAVMSRLFGPTPKHWATECAVHLGASRVFQRRQHEAALRVANRVAQPLLAYLDLSAVFARDLITVTMFQAKHSKKVLWGISEQEGKPTPSAILMGLLSNFIASDTALRELVARGFNAPARVLFRSQVEVCDLLLACILSRDFFEKYRAWPEGEPDARHYWRKHLGPSLVTELVAGIYSTPSLPPEIREKAISSRRERYARLSQFAHGQPTAVRAGAVEEDIATGTILWAPSGRFGKGAIALLDDVLVHHWEFFQLLVHGLAGRHGWAMKGRKEAEFIALHWAVLEQLVFLLHPDARSTGKSRHRTRRRRARPSEPSRR